MADLKISQLAGATTPLAGTEVLPIVQGGATKQVSVANLTAGRTQTSNGIVQGSAATGYNFTANTPAAGMTSQLLNWYEEGTWTPVISTTGTAPTISSYSNRNGFYTRIGNRMFISCMLRANVSSAGTGDVLVTGLPFTIKSGTYDGISVGISNLLATQGPWRYGETNSTRVVFEGAVLATGVTAYITFSANFPI